MVKILILGSTGLLGHKIFLNLYNENFNVYATVRDDKVFNIIKKTYKDLKDNIFFNVDINNFSTITKLLHKNKFDIVINCIGLIKQIPISNEPLQSIYINSLFPHKLALECAKKNIRVIHFSTDCVFSGKKGNYIESDIGDAEDLYGRTKYLGELHYDNCLTIRTSIIGHEINTRNGLVEWFLSQDCAVKGYLNAIFSGFPTIEIKNILVNCIINSNIKGLFHLSSEPISKFELLRLISKKYSKKLIVEPNENVIINRSLNSSKFKGATGYTPPSWAELVDLMYLDFLDSIYYCK